MKKLNGKFYVDEKDGCFGGGIVKVNGCVYVSIGPPCWVDDDTVQFCCAKVGDKVDRDGYVNSYDVVMNSKKHYGIAKKSTIKYGILK